MYVPIIPYSHVVSTISQLPGMTWHDTSRTHPSATVPRVGAALPAACRVPARCRDDSAAEQATP